MDLSFVGGLASAVGGAATGFATNSAARAEGRRNRQWMENMISKKHQIEVKDLRAAGLNPILSATGGSGSGTPSSAMASMHTPDVSSGLNEMGRSLGGAISRKIDKMRVDNEKTRINNENELFRSNIDLNSAKAETERSLSDFNRANADLIKTRNAVDMLGLASARIASQFSSSKVGKFLELVSRGSQAVQGIMGGLHSAYGTYSNIRDDYNYNHYGVVPRR